jgi:hypothetical protein
MIDEDQAFLHFERRTGAKRRNPRRSPVDCAYCDEAGRYLSGDPAQRRTSGRGYLGPPVTAGVGLSLDHGKQIVVESSHEMPTEHPEVVISAIHEVWLAAHQRPLTEVSY